MIDVGSGVAVVAVGMENRFWGRAVQGKGIGKEMVLSLLEVWLASGACIGTRWRDVVKVLVDEQVVSGRVLKKEEVWFLTVQRCEETRGLW
jgi:hypothetical protein